MTLDAPRGPGLGLRKELLPQLENTAFDPVQFFEIAPENWLTLGGKAAHSLRALTERYPFACHGLSLSIGSADPLDTELLRDIRAFLDLHQIPLYTEHLSWCSYQGHLYDLLPVPFTEDAVHWVAARVRQAQDILGRQIGLENASYYFTPPEAEMTEQAFVRAVIQEADCLLHLDVNNLYVNSQNFGYDPTTYLQALPLDRVCYLHVAGHYQNDDGILVDTHGADVIDPVWHLLELAYQQIGGDARSLPTCLERDFNFPGLENLLTEVRCIERLQHKYGAPGALQARAPKLDAQGGQVE